jgi:SAM-dependent methyltransferase
LTPDATWSGEKGRFWAQHAEWFSLLLSEFGEALVDGADLQPGERVLDVGCGNGDVTVAAAVAVAPDGSVVGVDLSPDQVSVATVRASRADLTNVELRVADASSEDLGGPYDVLVSRFGVMFFDDPVAAFTHLHGALGADGRLAFVCWAPLERNPWLLDPRNAAAAVLTIPDSPPDGPGPFSFAETDHVRGVLQRAGFRDVRFEAVERPVHLGASLDDALAFLTQMDWAKAAFDAVAEEQRDQAVDRMRAVVADRTLPDGRIDLPSTAWLVRARR